MSRKKRTKEELRIASDHLQYEYWMLISLANGMASNLIGEGPLNNAIVEAYVIHVRNLIYFLYGKKQGNNHIIARDFFNSAQEWGDLRPKKSDSLAFAERRAHKEVAHLSYDRAKVTPETKKWHYIELANEIASVFQLFLRNIPPELLGNRWLLDKLKIYEEDVRYQELASENEPEFTYIQGNIPILISAPHGAAHKRDNEYKEEDEFTAGMVGLLNEVTGANAIYARRQSETDPNIYKDVPYKDEIRRICLENEIGIVIDIHGMSAKRPAGIELGTMKGKSCKKYLPIIKTTLYQNGFLEKNEPGISRLLIDEKFTGAGNEKAQTVIGFVWEKLEIPAIQVEINGHLRIVERKKDATSNNPFIGNHVMIEKTVNTFIEIINNLATEIGTN